MTEKPIDPGEEEEVFVGTPPAGDPDPEEYVSIDQQGGISEDTGTAYDPDGEPQTTPHDVVVEEDE